MALLQVYHILRKWAKLYFRYLDKFTIKTLISYKIKGLLGLHFVLIRGIKNLSY